MLENFMLRIGSGGASLADMYRQRAAVKLDRACVLMKEMKETPPEMRKVIDAAKAIFESAPIPVWAKWADDDARNVYSNPTYKATNLDHEGMCDRQAWGDETVGLFASNDSAAARQSGGLLVHEWGKKPTTSRVEHWWIAKWRQIVDTADGPRTLVWGALLSTVAHHRQGLADVGQESRG